MVFKRRKPFMPKSHKTIRILRLNPLKKMNKLLFCVALLFMLPSLGHAQEKLYDVIIIGGGLSGLTAAHYLETNNFLILEKEATAGGRIIEGQWEGFHYPKGTEYIGEPDGVLKQLLADLDLPVIAVPPPTDGIGYQGKIYTKDKIFDFLPTQKDRKQFRKLQRGFARVSRKTEDFIWENEALGKHKTLDQVSVSQWLAKYDVHPLVEKYINIENLGLFSANNDELSILYNANEMAYNLPSRKGFDASEVFTFPNGMVDLSNALNQQHASKVQYRTEVIAVHLEADNTLKISATIDGEESTFKAKKVICTTPAPIAKEILKPSISQNAFRQLSKIEYGQYITINLFTKKRWLKEAWTVSCLDNYFTSIYDVTRTQTEPDYAGKSIISAYIPSISATDKTFIQQSDDEVLEKTLTDMELYFPGLSASVLGYDIQRFQYAYPVFGLGYLEVLQALEDDSSLNTSIFLAGDYMKYAVVDGAILSGYWAAKKVNCVLGQQ